MMAKLRPEVRQFACEVAAIGAAIGATIITFAILSALSGCKSATKELAADLNTLNKINATIGGHAEAIDKAASLVDDSINGALAEETITPSVTAALGPAQAATASIHAHASAIESATKHVYGVTSKAREDLTGVKDITPWWATLMSRIAVAAVILLILIALLYTGAGSFVRGWLSMLTPSGRKAKGVFAKVHAGEMSHDEAVAALAKIDPKMRAAHRAARRKQESTDGTDAG